LPSFHGNHPSVACLTSAEYRLEEGSGGIVEAHLGGSSLPCRGQEAPQRALNKILGCSGRDCQTNMKSFRDVGAARSASSDNHVWALRVFEAPRKNSPTAHG
jgi:hypothetical protein